MPNVAQAISPNIFKGRAGLAIRAVCIHIAQGSYIGSVDWLTKTASGVSSHFMVAKDGRITQMVNLFDTAYANGLSWSTLRNSWIDPDGNAVKPSWIGLKVPINPNYTTVSVEHEGFTGEPWTPAMYDADRKILLYIQSQTPLSYIPHDTLIGHNEISPLSRANCPGTGVDFAKMIEPDYAALWGPHYAYHHEWGIETAWRPVAATLGEAQSDETGDHAGRVWRLFSRGAISYEPKDGSTVVYVPRKP